MSGPLRVVLIDEAGGRCRELHAWLEEAGHRVELGASRRGALGFLSGIAADLVILGVAGNFGAHLESSLRIGSHCQRQRLPLIVVSDDPELAYELPDLFDFQVFPADRARLLSCVNRLEETREAGASRLGFGLADLSPFRDFLESHTGLHFGAHNQRLLERGLMRRMQALCLADPGDYLDFLAAADGNQEELNRLLGLLTVGETCFFRYRTHHEALIHSVFPELLARNAASRRLSIWSAGCSTGEEPYSLAMKLLENFPQLSAWDVRILATDINKRALRLAREGVYPERSLRQVEPHYRQGYFSRSGQHFLVVPRVRQLVRFAYHNLQSDSYPDAASGTADLDLILCRNVLIYFRAETIRQIIARFAACLSPGGYLFLGHAETLQSLSDRFARHHQHGAFYYQLKPPAPPRQASLPSSASAAVPRTAVPAAKEAPLPPSPPSFAAPPPVAPPPDPEALCREGLAAFDREAFAAADALFDRALAVRPDLVRALVGKGLLCANRGAYQDARQWCARALRLDDLCAEAYLLRGLILDMEEQLERALVEYQKVLWLDREFVMAHYLAARVHERLGRDEDRRRALRNTIRALEKRAGVDIVPFSGGLSPAVLLELCRRQLITPASGE